jgi:carboxymethylenebutenolidase
MEAMMTGRMVDYGGERSGYLAMPEGGTGPGVLVLHAWWGLNDFLKSVADRLAAAGYVAFAPDLYGGKVAETPDQAAQLGEALDHEVMQDTSALLTAVDFLQQQAAVRGAGIGIVGFSLGAAYAMMLAGARGQDVRAVVLFYGTGPADFDADPRAADTAFLGHFAGQDEWEPRENVEALRAALEQAGRTATFHFYDGTGHWFFEADRPDAYRRAAAELAWQRTLTFLAERLPA